MSTHIRPILADFAMKPIDDNQPPKRRFASTPINTALATTALAMYAFVVSKGSGVKTSGGNSSSDRAKTVAPLSAFEQESARVSAPIPAHSGSPRLTRAPYIQWTTTRAAHIVWNTDTPSTSVVDYALVSPTEKISTSAPRMSTHAAWQRVAKVQLVARHIVKLASLKASSVYAYRIISNGRALFEGRFQTDKQAGEAARFAIWGDSGVADQWQYQIAARLEKARPDCLIHTGDLIYPSGASKDFDPEFFRVYARLLSRVPFYGSLGNHDVETKNGAPFLANFVFPKNGPARLAPERNYSCDYAGAHWVVVDSTQSEASLRNNVVPWLERDLRASRATWKFAVFHHPPFSSGEHGDEIRTKRALVLAFARLKVDIVFNGHDHGYERWKPRAGVVYITTAAGGANLYKRRRHDPLTASYHNEIHSWTQLDLKGKTLRGTQLASNGRVLDAWTMRKP